MCNESSAWGVIWNRKSQLWSTGGEEGSLKRKPFLSSCPSIRHNPHRRSIPIGMERSTWQHTVWGHRRSGSPVFLIDISRCYTAGWRQEYLFAFIPPLFHLAILYQMYEHRMGVGWHCCSDVKQRNSQSQIGLCKRKSLHGGIRVWRSLAANQKEARVYCVVRAHKNNIHMLCLML